MWSCVGYFLFPTKVSGVSWKEKQKKKKKGPHRCGPRFVNLLEFICLVSLSVATWCIWSMKGGWPSMTCKITANNVFLVLSKIHNKDMRPSDLRLPKPLARLPADIVYTSKGMDLFLLVKLSIGKGSSLWLFTYPKLCRRWQNLGSPGVRCRIRSQHQDWETWHLACSWDII